MLRRVGWLILSTGGRVQPGLLTDGSTPEREANNPPPSRAERNEYAKIQLHSSTCFHGAVPHDKAIPLQVWTGTEGSRRLKLPDSKKIGKRKC